MEELWRDVVGFEQFYKVSNMGRIYSKRTNKMMKTPTDKRGYSQFNMSGLNGFKRHRLVHQEVARAFLGERPSNKFCDHINGIRTDNRLSNLQYITHRENVIKGKCCLMKEKSSSKFVGVTFHKRQKKWHAYKRYDGKSYFLGSFDDEKQAARAYQMATKKHCESLSWRKYSKEKYISYNKSLGYWTFITPKAMGRKCYCFKTEGEAINFKRSQYSELL